MLACGFNDTCHLGALSDPGRDYISELTSIDVDVNEFSSFSTGSFHTVAVLKNGDVLACGDDRVSQIGSNSRQIYKSFTKITNLKSMAYAACGNGFTLYVSQAGKLILSNKNRFVEIPMKKRIIVSFAGLSECGAIDEDGAAYFFNIESTSAAVNPQHFNAPVVEMVLCFDYCVLLLADKTTLGNKRLNKNRKLFVPIESLAEVKVVKIVGYDNSCLALTEDGKVFAYGENYFCQLGNGSNRRLFNFFVQIKTPEFKIKDITMNTHTLFLSEDGELYGCGLNKCKQLINLKSQSDNIQNITKIELPMKVSDVFAGNNSTIILTDIELPQNPAKIAFSNYQINENIVEQQKTEQNIEVTAPKLTNEELVQKLQEENQSLKQKIVEIEYLHKEEMNQLNAKIQEFMTYIDDVLE